jgi:hypothetical protein
LRNPAKERASKNVKRKPSARQRAFWQIQADALKEAGPGSTVVLGLLGLFHAVDHHMACVLEERAEAARRVGASGGRKRLTPDDEDPRLQEVLDARGAKRSRLARELAAERGVKADSVIRAARRVVAKQK